VQQLFGAVDDGRTYPLRATAEIGTERPRSTRVHRRNLLARRDTLFATFQTPGIMLAITGPWRRQGQELMTRGTVEPATPLDARRTKAVRGNRRNGGRTERFSSR